MAAGPLRGGSSRWAASAHPALAVQVGQAQPVFRSIRDSLPCDAAAIAGLRVFAYSIYLGVTFCAMLFVFRVCFSGGVFSVGMWCLAAPHLPSLFLLGRLANFLFARCPSQCLLFDKSSVALTAASAWAVQLVRQQDSLSCSTTSLVASACPAPVRMAWGGRRWFLGIFRALPAQAGLAMFAGSFTS